MLPDSRRTLEKQGVMQLVAFKRAPELVDNRSLPQDVIRAKHEVCYSSEFAFTCAAGAFASASGV